MSLEIYQVFLVVISLAAFVQGERNQTINEGSPLELTYQKEDPEDSCKWAIPGEVIELVSGEPVQGGDNRPSNWTAEYYGSSPLDCGVRIPNTYRADEGAWQTVNGAETIKHYISINVKPASPPVFTDPQKFVDGSPSFSIYSPDSDLRENVTCQVKDVRPPPIFVWEMDGEQFNESNIYQDDNPVGGDLFSPQSILTYNPKPSHDGKQLRCVIQHPALDGELQVVANITVTAPPEPDNGGAFISEEDAIIGRAATINIKFISNPYPEELLWFTPDLLEPVQGGNYTPAVRSSGSPSFSSGRYTAYIAKIGEGNEYLSTLTLAELTQEDVDQSFTLMVTNSIGSSNYTYTFTDVKNVLSGGAIAGIVIGCLAIVILIGVAVVLVMKKKKKSKKVKFPKTQERTIPEGGFPNLGATDD
ncbi:hypothetical protein TCAL_01689 [Tigriopus californicus]|uniref:Ig-like domain-containing protein n=1 Tax=Tigriopus californicus TaxID=6832 RepID=A0A553PJA5_TIGCA|nr:uncharacterized protein LOC131890356 [Tigriopus californicus]TRY77777.1 hypothetical protein TCAL_01689 [Tigriopus californicus]|eukprot:TCALIF_01689-PA protein Name:"Protein of unknown function" AED:0.00 eAED:0.00 QI:31/1/0.87/1/1/1/8/75/416